MIWIPELHLLRGAAVWIMQEKNSYSDLEITGRPDRNERWLSVLLVISLVAYVIVVPGLYSDFNHLQESIFTNNPPAYQGTPGVTTGSVLTDNRFITQENYSSANEAGKTYCIIVGSFVNPENARIAAEKYNRQGYQTNIITTSFTGGKKAELVAVRIFSNFNDASSFLSDFRSRVEPEAWIFSN